MPSVPSPAAANRSGLRRLLLAVAVAWLSWIAVAFGLLPGLIRAAYDGDSLPILNRLITGQAEHPVGFYLDAGRALAWRGALGIPVAGLLALPFVLFRHSLRDRLSRLRRRIARPAVGPGSALWVAAAIGLVSGAIEGGIVFGRQVLETPPPPGVIPSIAVWLGAPVAGLAMVTLALPVVVWAGARGGRLGVRPLVVALGTVGAYGVLVTARLGLHPAAALLLAAGLATALGRLAAARPAEFVVGARRTAVAVILLSVATGGGMGLQTRLEERAMTAGLGPAPTRAPNVLIVVWDAVRARNLSLYGHARPTSPRLDSLAARGVTFETAIAPSSWSLPSHATLFTGRYPHRLDVDWQDFLGERWPTLAETLTDEGYRTAGFSANPFYASRAAGVGRGFAHYEDAHLSLGTLVGTAWILREPLHWVRRRMGDYRDLTLWRAEAINQALLDWLDAGEQHPFFAFVNYFDAHDPYRPPSPYDTLFTDPGARYWPGPGTTDRERAELEASYDNGIAYADHALGELLDALDRRGLTDETLVIVTSDHGEQFGETDPRALTHGWGLDHWLLHVPLVMVFPDRIPAGARVSSPVGLRDVPATVLDLVGLEGPSTLPGTSLGDLWDGGAASVSPALSWAAPPRNGGRDFEPLAKGPMFSLHRGDLHYIVEGDGTEYLYDVVRDPWERTDLAADPAYADALAALRAVVNDLRTGDVSP